MSSLFLNLSASLSKPVRIVKNGREYLVAPLTLIVPGVLNGSEGPLLYTLNEIKKNFSAWNGMPMMLGHPYDPMGKPVSARDPDVEEKFRIGTVYKARVTNKLGAEGWFDVALLRKIAPQILTNLEAGKPIELSTGLFLDKMDAPKGATHNGRPYSFMTGNYRPDHLAILQNEQGACSLADGCGVLINSNKLLEKSKTILAANGGSGSGNFGHAGRPGEKGGSSSGNSVATARGEKAKTKKEHEEVAEYHDGLAKSYDSWGKSDLADLHRGERDKHLEAATSLSKKDLTSIASSAKESADHLKNVVKREDEASQKATSREEYFARISSRNHAGLAHAAHVKVYQHLQSGGDLHSHEGKGQKLLDAAKEAHAGAEKAQGDLNAYLSRASSRAKEPEGGERDWTSSSRAPSSLYRNSVNSRLAKKSKSLLVANSSSVKGKGMSQKFSPEEREEIVNHLISNSCGCWTEEEKETLNAMNDERLAHLYTNSVNSAANELIANAVRKSVPKGTKDKDFANVIANAFKPKPASEDAEGESEDSNEDGEEGETPPKKGKKEGMAAKPACNENQAERLTSEEIEDLQFARNEKQKRKDSLIQKLTANLKGEAKTKQMERLSTRSLVDLESDLELLPPVAPAPQMISPAPLYNGAANPYTPVANSGNFDASDTLIAPRLTFSKNDSN